MPKSENAIQFRKPAFIQKCFKQNEPWRDILKILTVESKKRPSNIFYQMAYDYLAPLLIIFSIIQWRRFRKQKVEIVYYLARDARTLLDVYDLLADILPGSCPRRYIRLSRRAIAIAHPDDLLQNVKHIAGKFGKKQISHWLSNFSVSTELRQNILSHAGLDENSRFTASNRKSLMVACHKLLPDITKEQIVQKAIIRDYLFQEAGGNSFQRVGIVDSGWACTTQDIIQSLLTEAELVSGMYLGVSHQGMKPDSRNSKYGLLRDDFRNCQYHNPLESTAGVIRVWETILREPTQTILTLQRSYRNLIIPIIDTKQIVAELEKQRANDIYSGVCDGTYARIKQASIMIQLLDKYSDTDFEIAATMTAKKISSYPSKHLANAIINIGFDEGAAGGQRGNLGVQGIRKGIAWYPGILSSIGLQRMLPILVSGVRILLSWQRNRPNI
jgi:hypothetical protein